MANQQLRMQDDVKHDPALTFSLPGTAIEQISGPKNPCQHTVATLQATCPFPVNRSWGNFAIASVTHQRVTSAFNARGPSRSGQPIVSVIPAAYRHQYG